MLSFPASVRIFVAPGITDMRKSFDGLARLVREVIEEDPLSGHVFAFCNRRRDRVKILIWDRSGFWLLAKRLEKGTFPWPAAVAGQRRCCLTSADLSAILGGIDLEKHPRRRWLDRMGKEVSAETP